jgi:hypothetical protein
MGVDIPHNVWYNMKQKKRLYISVYFDDALLHNRKRRDVTLAFAEDDDLFRRCKHLGSSEIKKIIGLSSYSELANKAREEDRSLSNYIKYQLRIHFKNEQENTPS